MPQGKGPRIVQVFNDKGRVGLSFVYSDSTSQGTELLIIRKDAQTNAVNFEFKPGRYGENFVEIGEDTSGLGQEEREHFNRKPEVTQDVDTGEIVETNTTPSESLSARERRKQEKRDKR